MEPEWGDYPYQRAQVAIARARETEGVTENGMMRTAIVESAAAITEALFDLSSSVENALRDPDAAGQDIAYKLSNVADAIEKIADKLPRPGD